MMVAQACLNLRPELFRACILNSPFLDVLNSLLDSSLPLSETDYLEFGNPVQNKDIYHLINSYCPYQNLTNREHPACLIQTAVDDPRVPVWSTLKFLEKLRDFSQEPQKFPDFLGKNIACRVMDEEGSGHFGSASNESNLAMQAYEFAWLDFMIFKKTQS